MKAWADGVARQTRRVVGAVTLGLCGLLAACGGGGGDAAMAAPQQATAGTAAADGDVELLAAVPGHGTRDK